MFGIFFCLSCAGKQELYGYIQMRPGGDLRLCYQEHNEEYSKKLAVYNLFAGYYFSSFCKAYFCFRLIWILFCVWQIHGLLLESLAFID